MHVQPKVGRGLLKAMGVLAVATVAVGMGPSRPAHAGVYDVHACDAAGGINNSWVPNTTHTGLAAYAECPSAGNPNRGIVTRNVVQPASWSVPGGLGAQAFFYAPEGTAIIGIQASYWFHREYAGYMVGLSNGSQQLKGCGTGGSPCEVRSAGEYIPVPPSWVIYIETFCAMGPCPTDSTGDPTHNYLRGRAILYSASVRLEDGVAPRITSPSGSLWSDGWKRGTQAVAFEADDNTGIQSARLLIGEREVAQRAKACDYTRTVPCPQGGDELRVETDALRSDGAHVARIQVTDAAGNVSEISRAVLIDNAPPDPPQELTLDGGEAWRSLNDFDVRWKLPAQNTGAPIAGAEYELCLPNGTACIRGHKDGRDLSSLSDLKVPAPGEYVLKLWLRDEAGNQDARLAAPVLRLRYDDASPELAFEPISVDDPTLVTVKTNDRASGVRGGQIEMRRNGDERWLALPTGLDGARLAARVADERLRDGIYELRARAVDHAGNERSTDVRADGSKAEIRLPVRLKTRLRAGVVRRSGRRSRLARNAYVRYGQLVRVRGRLVTPEGNPMQDVEVQAFTQIRDGMTPPRLIATVRTNRTGRFSFLVRRGPSRTIRIRYGGTNHIRSATRTLALNVRSRTTIAPSRIRLSNGETVRFRGRIRTGRIPDRGKLVELQVWVRGRWRTFATTRAGRQGRWRYPYRFDGTRGTQTYRFRAKVPPEAGYPFATGRSRVVRVRVSGA